jgi:hypothetical protein
MQTLHTNDGAMIEIEAGTDEATIAILKVAPVFVLGGFAYTGNHAEGRDSSNDEELIAWLRAAGLQLVEDTDEDAEPDGPWLVLHMEKVSGIAEVRHRGKALRYHAQQRRGETVGHGRPSMGYTWQVDYRLISCE